MKLKKRTRVSVIVVAVAAGVILVGVAWAAGGISTSSSSTPTPVTYTKTQGWAPSVPSGATAAEIVNSIVQQAGFGNSMQVSLSGQSLSFDIPTTGSLAANAYAAWQADIVQGVVAEAFANQGLPPIAGSTFTGELPSGQTVDIGGGMGNIQPGQSYSSDDDSAITQRITDLLPQWNLTLSSIHILHAGQPAPAVFVTTNDPNAAAAAATPIVRTLFGQDPPLYEGYYFQVNDTKGNLVLLQSAAFRDGAGQGWADPSVAASSSLNHG